MNKSYLTPSRLGALAVMFFSAPLWQNKVGGIFLICIQSNHMQPLKTIRSFKPAFKGIVTGFSSENNFSVHLLATVAAVALGVFFHIHQNEWLWICGCIGAVFTIEYLNTAIEKLTDLVSPTHNDLAGKVKDLSAAAVLITALTSAMIGGIIFIPYIIN